MKPLMGWILAAATVVWIGIIVAWTWTSLVERSVIRDADRRSYEWTKYAAARLERIEELGQGEAPTASEWALIEELAQFGGVFRFKVFSPEGVLRFASDEPDVSGADLGAHNATAAGVLATGEPFTVVADGRSKPNRPDLYSETYLPVVRDGAVVAIVEVYADQTATAAAVRKDYAFFGIVLFALFAAAIAIPAAAIWLLIQRLRQRNGELEVERHHALAADRAKSEFLSTVSHELRTPMNGIIGVVQLLDTVELPEEDRELIDILRSCSEAQMTLIEEILTFGEVEAGALRIVTEPVDISTLVKSATGFAVLAARDREIEFNIEMQPDLPNILIDAKRMRQIIANLVGNAVKFTQEGSVDVRVSVSDDAEKDLHMLQIDVKDTGPGIATEHHSPIFERFTQGDSSLSRKAGGTGLGLAIARAIAQEMGGGITLKSALGSGSTFTLRLPVHLVQPSSNEKPIEKEAA